jgi:hypothetical protein
MQNTDKDIKYLYLKYKIKYLNLKGGNLCLIKNNKQNIFYYYINDNQIISDPSPVSSRASPPHTNRITTHKPHHHTQTALQPKDKLSKLKFDMNMNITKFLELISCDINAYFYFEYIDIIVANKINKLLEDIAKTSSNTFHNVSIINLTKSTKTVIYSIKKDNHYVFKKVLNIFTNSYERCINMPHISDMSFNESYIIDIKDTDTNIDCINTVYDKGLGPVVNYNKLIGGAIHSEPIHKIITKQIIYKFINLNLDKSVKVKDFKETWWYHYLMDVPYCGYGRLLQSTGTCWCNASLNALFLTDKIKKLLIESYTLNEPLNKIADTLTFKDFIDKTPKPNSLRDLLFTMIKLLLINNDKAVKTDNNIIAIIAAKIKGLSESKDEDHYKKSGNIEYGESHDSSEGIRIILNTLLNKDLFINEKTLLDEYNSKVAEFNSKLGKYEPKKQEYDSKVDKYNLKVGEYNLKSKNTSDKEFEKVKDNFQKVKDNFQKVEDEFQKVEDEFQKVKDNFQKVKDEFQKVDDTFKKLKKHIIGEDLSEKKFVMTNINHNIFIININTLKSLKAVKSIKINGKIYKLEACTLSNVSHSIAGLHCDDKYYIYDSNNYISYDDWPNGIITNYLGLLKNNNVKYKDKPFILDTLIYVKQ